MRKEVRQRWIAGLVFLLAALGWLSVEIGWLNFHISAMTFIVTIILAIILGSCVLSLNVFGSVFSLAFLVMLYAGPLGITHLVPWTILGIALLISIGLSLILRPVIHKQRWKKWQHWFDQDNEWHTPNFIDSTGTDNDSYIHINAEMGDTNRYIESQNFKQADIHASMADVNIYFDKVNIQGDSAIINIDGYMCDIDITVPHDWNIVNNIDPYLGGVEAQTKTGNPDSPTVYLNGRVSLGDLKVLYV